MKGRRRMGVSYTGLKSLYTVSSSRLIFGLLPTETCVCVVPLMPLLHAFDVPERCVFVVFFWLYCTQVIVLGNMRLTRTDNKWPPSLCAQTQTHAAQPEFVRGLLPLSLMSLSHAAAKAKGRRRREENRFICCTDRGEKSFGTIFSSHSSA